MKTDHSFTCPHCESVLEVNSEAAAQGISGPCPDCGQHLEIQHQLESETDAAVPVASKPRWTARKSLAAAAGIAVLGTGVFLAMRPGKGTGEIAQDAPSPAPVVAQLPKGPVELINAFLKSETWARKKAFVLEPDRLDARGLAYYDGRDPDEITASSFQPSSIDGLTLAENVQLFIAKREIGTPVLALIKEEQGKWSLDWELFTQSFDGAFDRFFARPDFAIRSFRVILEGLPATKEGNVLRLAVIDPQKEGHRLEFEFEGNSIIRSELGAGLAQRNRRFATVEMSFYKENETKEMRPMLNRLVSWDWNGLAPLPPAQDPTKLISPETLAGVLALRANGYGHLDSAKKPTAEKGTALNE